MGKPAARVGDNHTCPMVDPGPKPHVGGPILPPAEPTVLIGGPPAARLSDKATCIGPIDNIVQGWLTVLIGGMPSARIGDMTAHGGVIVAGWMTVEIGNPTSLMIMGTPGEQKTVVELVNNIRNAGPKCQANVESMESNPNKTRISIAPMFEDNIGQFHRVSNGLTVPGTGTKSGDTEIFLNLTTLPHYRATDGTQPQVTAEGLLVHEMGHANFLNINDPSHTNPGITAERAVINHTNPKYNELGIKPRQLP